MASVDVTAESFDPEARLASFRSGVSGAGAIISMTGLVRPGAEDGKEVTELILHHYPGFTEVQIMSFAQEVEDRCGIEAIGVVHRVGRILPREAIVLVMVASCHRRQGFAAAERIMDYLKVSAPFWKQEVGSAGVEWVNPRSEDYAYAALWNSAKLTT